MDRAKSIELLNKAIGEELVAVHQYMYFHFHCDDQGYDLLTALFKRTAIEEMIHIENLADRVLFLKGEIEMVAADSVKKINTVKEMLEFATDSENSAVEVYNDYANQCSAHSDSVSKKLFEALVVDEERHFSQFDDEMENLERFGNEYLAMQSMERSKAKSGMPPGHPGV